MRTVSYFFFFAKLLRSKPKHTSREKRGRKRGRSIVVYNREGVSEGVASWFTIALAEIRTKRILKEKADSTQSIIEKEHLKSISNNFVFAIHAKPTL